MNQEGLISISLDFNMQLKKQNMETLPSRRHVADNNQDIQFHLFEYHLLLYLASWLPTKDPYPLHIYT